MEKRKKVLQPVKADHQLSFCKTFYFYSSYYLTRRRSVCDVIVKTTENHGAIVLGQMPREGNQKEIARNFRVANLAEIQNLRILSLMQPGEYRLGVSRLGVYGPGNYSKVETVQQDLSCDDLIKIKTEDPSFENITFSILPILDTTCEVSLADIDSEVNKLKKHVIDDKNPLYVHCKAGVGRSFLVMWCFLYKYSKDLFGKQYSPFEVYQYISQMRDVVEFSAERYETVLKYANSHCNFQLSDDACRDELIKIINNFKLDLKNTDHMKFWKNLAKNTIGVPSNIKKIMMEYQKLNIETLTTDQFLKFLDFVKKIGHLASDSKKKYRDSFTQEVYSHFKDASYFNVGEKSITEEGEQSKLTLAAS